MGRIRGVTPDETRSRLLEAAATVFAERGYERATIAGIAEEAGLSSGAIYAHYRSKAELLVETIRAHGEAEVADLLSGDDPADFGAMVVALGGRLEASGPATRLLLVEALVAARRDPELAAVLAERLQVHQRSMAATLRSGQEHGLVVEEVSPEVIARFLLMVGLGARLFRTLGLDPLDEGEWSAFTSRMVEAFRT